MPGEKTKDMMYDLVDVVLQMGQRVRELELKNAALDNVNTKAKEKALMGRRREMDYKEDFPEKNEPAEHR